MSDTNLHPIFQAALAPFRPLTVFEVVQEAFDSAADASFAYLSAYGDHADCGGAWVVIPGRSLIAKHCKTHGIGIKHHSGGWAIPVCTRLRAQSRAVYEKGCDAFVKVLDAHGFEGHVYSYAD